MFRSITAAFALSLALSGAAFAEVHEVRMLNRGAEGAMVFEPAALRVAEGDTVRFVAADRGHNAEVVDGMLPEGATAFSGRINEEIEVILDVPGFYGIRCTPHFAMGMVMVIAVGDAEAPGEDFLAGRIPARALARFEAGLSAL